MSADCCVLAATCFMLGAECSGCHVPGWVLGVQGAGFWELGDGVLVTYGC